MKTYLKSAHLKGFKTIKDLKVDFEPGLNIIIGKNGSGKTNFLNFLYSALKNIPINSSNLFSELSYMAEVPYTIKYTSSFPEITGERLRDAIPELSTNFEVKWGKKQSNFSNIKDFLDFLSETNLATPQSIIIPHGIRKNNLVIDAPLTFNLKFNDPNELLDIWTSNNNSYFVRCLGSALFVSAFINDTDESLKSAENVSNKVLGEFCDAINLRISQYLPIDEVRISPNFRIYSDGLDNGFKFESLTLEYNFNGSWLPFSSLSDGTKRLFCIYADILAFEALETTMPNFHSKGVIILLEEPELGIHPHQFHKIMTFLKEMSESAQIIITTHSPQALDIVSQDELKKIKISSYNNEEGTQLNVLTEAETAKAKAYMNEMYLSDFWLRSTLDRK